MPKDKDTIEEFCLMSDNDKIQLAVTMNPAELVGYLCLFAQEIRKLRDKCAELDAELAMNSTRTYK